MIWIWKFSHHRFETSTVIAILILVFVALDKKDILLIGAIQKICTQRFFHFMTTIPPLTLSINIIFFSVRVFFHGHWRLMRQQGKGEDHFLFHSTTSTRSRTFRHLFATLHVRWLSHIFNRIACIYQTATRWDLPPCRITIWLIDDVKFVLVCLLDDLILGFCYSNLDAGNRWARTCIGYHPCITSKPTNQYNDVS